MKYRTLPDWRDWESIGRDAAESWDSLDEFLGDTAYGMEMQLSEDELAAICTGYIDRQAELKKQKETKEQE